MRKRAIALVIAVAALGATSRFAAAYDVVLSTQGEYMDGYLVNGHAFPPRVIVDDPDPHPATELTGPPLIGGRHLNGPVCFFPPKAHRPGQYIVADDTYRESCIDARTPQGRCTVTNPLSPFFIGADPDGWAVLDRSGRWTREHIHTPWNLSEPQPQGNKDPQGCAFDSQGRLFAIDVGSEEAGKNDGSLIVFFPGPRSTYETYCFLDKGLASPGMPAIDQGGNLYVPEPQAGQITKFSPPYPSSAAECNNPERLVTKAPGKTTWLNVVTACSPCNLSKGGHMPGDVDMWPRNMPFRPTVQQLHANGRLFPPGDIESLSRTLLNLSKDPASVDRWRARLPKVRSMDEIASDYLDLYAASRASGAP